MIRENKMDEKIKIDDTYVISDLETLKVLSDPFRLDLLRMVAYANKVHELRTVKQLAEELELPPTKLYYHVNLLEKHGLITVAETQVVSGIIEKKYKVIADNIIIDKHILATEEGPSDEKLEGLLASIQSFIDTAYQDFEKSMKTNLVEKLVEKEGGPPARVGASPHISGDDLLLSKEQAEDFKKQFWDVYEKFEKVSNENIDAKNDGLFYGFSIIFSPLYHRTKNPNIKENSENAEDE
jgi:DNA-binding transcriptional ArsR family regulator